MTDSGFDMFCEDHFKEALKHIEVKFPNFDIGYCRAQRDEEFDTDESMLCGFPGCIKESKYEIHWIKFDEVRPQKVKDFG